MSDNSSFNLKNGNLPSPQKESVNIKSTPVNRSRHSFKPIPVVEQVKIVTRLIEYLETR